MIPFNRASFDGDELRHLGEAIANGHVSGNGPFTKRAEAMLSALVGGRPVLLTTSCTHALELAARLTGLEPGDEVIVPSYSFVSSASAFAWNGARPVFADIRLDTLNLDPASVEAAITPRTRAVCVVHYAGVAAEPDRLAAIALRHGLTVIEDNAHGLGGTFRGQPLGTFGSMSTLSFHETKNVTCGEGGALVLSDTSLLERAEILREKGTDRSRFIRGLVDKYTWVDLGSSWVLSDLLAGVLVGQLERFEAIQAARARLWTTYARRLEPWATANGVDLPVVPDGCEQPSHMFYLRLPDRDHRDRLIDHLRARGVMAVFHYQALHTSAEGRRLGGDRASCPNAELAADTVVRLPLFATLTPGQQETVIAAVESFR